MHPSETTLIHVITRHYGYQPELWYNNKKKTVYKKWRRKMWKTWGKTSCWEIYRTALSRGKDENVHENLERWLLIFLLCCFTSYNQLIPRQIYTHLKHQFHATHFNCKSIRWYFFFLSFRTYSRKRTKYTNYFGKKQKKMWEKIFEITKLPNSTH